MSNSTLSSRAKALENDLKRKLKCYVACGWMREQDGTEYYMVYVDRRAAFRDKDIPSNWYGCAVVVQRVLPPGVQPPKMDFPGAAW